MIDVKRVDGLAYVIGGARQENGEVLSTPYGVPVIQLTMDNFFMRFTHTEALEVSRLLREAVSDA